MLNSRAAVALLPPSSASALLVRKNVHVTKVRVSFNRKAMIGRKNTGEQKPSNGRRSAFVLALPKNCHDDAGLVEGSDDDAAFADYRRFVI